MAFEKQEEFYREIKKHNITKTGIVLNGNYYTRENVNLLDAMIYLKVDILREGNIIMVKPFSEDWR